MATAINDTWAAKLKKSVYVNCKRGLQNVSELLHDVAGPTAFDHPLPIDAFNKLTDRVPLYNFLTYRCADDEGIWLNDNPYGMDSYLIGFEVIPLTFVGDSVTKSFESLFKQLPTGVVIHSIAHANNDLRGYYERWFQASRSDNELIDSLLRRRLKYFLDVHDGRLEVMPGNPFRFKSINHFWFMRIPCSLIEYTPEGMAQFRAKVKNIIKITTSAFENNSFSVRKLSGSELSHQAFKFINAHINPNDANEFEVNLNEPLAPQLIERSTEAVWLNNGDIALKRRTPEKEQCKPHLLRSFAVTNMPTHPHYVASMADLLGNGLDISCGIGSSFYAYSIIEIADKDKILGNSLRGTQAARQMVSEENSLLKNLSMKNIDNIKKKEEIFKRFSSEEEGAAKALCGVVVCAQSEQELEITSRRIASMWGEKGFKINPESTINLPMWMATLPGQYRPSLDSPGRGLQRGTTMTAYNAASLLFLQSDWQGEDPGKGGNLLYARRGTPMNFNLFDSVENYNLVIAGASGTGKSVLGNSLVTDCCARNGMVRIIDLGASYQKTVERLGGTSISFSEDEQYCLNPFTGVKTRAQLREMLHTLTVMVMQMAYPFGYGELEDTFKNNSKDRPYEFRLISIAIQKVWNEKNSSMHVGDIVDYLKKFGQQEKNDRALDLVTQLYDVSEGENSGWFVGECNLDLSNPLFMLDLQGLNNQPELQNFVLNFLFTRISYEIYLKHTEEVALTGTSSKKYIIIDEAWNLLKRPNAGNFIEMAARTVRKFNASVIIMTQSIRDCIEIPAAKKLVENSNFITALGNQRDSLEEQNFIKMTDYELDLVSSTSKTNYYSELFYINKSRGSRGLYRLVLDPFSRLLYTTNKDECNLIARRTAQGMTLEEAINDILDTGAVA